MNFKTLAKSLLVVSLLASPIAMAKEKVYRWKLAETWGPNFPVFGDATKNMAKKVFSILLNRVNMRWVTLRLITGRVKTFIRYSSQRYLLV